jgi:DNA repair exonuclease SbcCD ATPase subunit
MKYKVIVNQFIAPIIVDATYHAFNSEGKLVFYKTVDASPHTALRSGVNNIIVVASFNNWEYFIEAEQDVTDKVTELKKQIKDLESDKTNLMREHHQLLEISTKDMAKIRILESAIKTATNG